MDSDCHATLDTLPPDLVALLPCDLAPLDQVLAHAHNKRPVRVYRLKEVSLLGHYFTRVVRKDRYKTAHSTRFEVAKLLSALQPGDSVSYTPSKGTTQLPSIPPMVYALARSLQLPGQYRATLLEDHIQISRNF